ncbi:MAG: hypothetical protein U0X86_001341 [Wolbachia endosymbiont of Xenopsylla cheopis]
MGKRKKTAGRKELISIYNDFVDGTVKLDMLSLDNHGRSFNITGSLLKHVINNLGYSDYNSCFNAFIMKCIKKDKMCLLTSDSDVNWIIEYFKSFALDQRYSEEFDFLLNDYFRIRQYPAVQGTRQIIGERCLYQHLHYGDKKQALEEIKCLNKCSQLKLNTSKNLKPLAPPSNPNRTNHPLHLNQIGNSNNEMLSYTLILLTMATFGTICLFICKFANKFFHKSEDKNEILSVKPLRNKKTRRGNIKAELPYSQLEDCLRSCKQDYKRGECRRGN